jgi:hypothetical protein
MEATFFFYQDEIITFCREPHKYHPAKFGVNWPSESLFLLISAAWLAEKQQILISVFCMTCLGSKPQSTTFEASTVTNTQLMQLIQLKLLFTFECLHI